MCACVQRSRGKTLDVLYHRLAASEPREPTSSAPTTLGLQMYVWYIRFFSWMLRYQFRSSSCTASVVTTEPSFLAPAGPFVCSFCLRIKDITNVSGIILGNSFDTVHAYEGDSSLLLFVP